MQLLFYYPITKFCILPIAKWILSSHRAVLLKSIWSYQRSLSGGCITQCLKIRFPLNVSLHEFDPKNFSHDSAKPLKSRHYPPALDGGWEVTGPLWVDLLLSFSLRGEVILKELPQNTRTWKMSWMATHVVKKYHWEQKLCWPRSRKMEEQLA